MIRLKIDIKLDEVLDMLDDVDKEIELLAWDEIKKYLEDVRELALSSKKWQDRTGSLREGHYIEATPDGWALIVDPTITGLKDYDYAPLLEYNLLPTYTKIFAWIWPAVEATIDDLPKRLAKRIEEKWDK